jgi:hypothetical protein
VASGDEAEALSAVPSHPAQTYADPVLASDRLFVLAAQTLASHGESKEIRVAE